MTVPDDLTRGRPIVLDMQRLELASDESSPAAARGRQPTRQIDPRTLPAISARADDFTWQARRFGRLVASIVARAARPALRLAHDDGAALHDRRQGQLAAMEQGAPRTRLALEFTSTDLAAAARALGYREAVDAKKAHDRGQPLVAGRPVEDVLARMDGTLRSRSRTASCAT